MSSVAASHRAYCQSCRHPFIEVDGEAYHRHVIADWWPNVGAFLSLHNPSGQSTLRIGDQVCCRHFKAHSCVRFTRKNNTPIYETEGQGRVIVVASRRPPPIKRVNNVDALVAQEARAQKRKRQRASLERDDDRNELKCFRLETENSELRAELVLLKAARTIQPYSLGLSFDDSDTRAAWLGLSADATRALYPALIDTLRVRTSNNARATPSLLIDLLLFSLRNGTPFSTLSTLTTVGRTSVTRLRLFVLLSLTLTQVGDWIKETEEDVRLRWVPTLVHLPDVITWVADSAKTHADHRFSDVLIFFVDGTPFESFVDSDHVSQRVMRNSKHAMSCWNVFFVVTPRGRFVARRNFSIVNAMF